MKKNLMALILMALIAFMGCSKKSMSDGLPGGNNCTGVDCPVTPTKFDQFKYMQVMYDSSSGQALNNAVINGDVYNLYPEVQTLLNITMKFPIQSESKSKSGSPAPWYTTLPGNFDLAKAGGDMTKALEDYLRTPEGKSYILTYLQQTKTNLDTIKAYADNSSGTLATDTASQIGTYVQIGANVAMMFAGVGDISTALNTFSMVGDVLGFGISSDSSMTQIFSALQDIKNKLQEIQVSLKNIENKIDKLNDIAVGLGITLNYQKVVDAKSYLESLSLRLKDSDPNSYVPYITENIIQGTGVYDYYTMFNDAFDAAVNTTTYIKNPANKTGTTDTILGDIDAPGVKLLKYPIYSVYDHFELVSDGFEGLVQQNFYRYYYSTTPTETTYKTKKPLNFSIMTLEDIALMKRISLTRLNVISKALSGSSLLNKRKTFIQNQDKIKLEQIKTSLKNIATLASSNFANSQYTPYNYSIQNNYILTSESAYCLFDQNKNYQCTASNNEFNTSNYFSDYAVWDDVPRYFPIVPAIEYTAKRTGTLTNQKILDSIKNSALTKTEIKDYVVSALAIIAEWEIQLRAHCIAAGVNYDSL